jgi:hypothetical protein
MLAKRSFMVLPQGRRHHGIRADSRQRLTNRQSQSDILAAQFFITLPSLMHAKELGLNPSWHTTCLKGSEGVPTMEMFLMALWIIVFTLAIAAAAFKASTGSETPVSAAQPEVPLVKEATRPRFFSDRVPVLPTQVPIEVLLLQIENHVRLEQAAAESFLEFPTHALLHSKTTSPFMN